MTEPYDFSPTEREILQEYAKICKMDCHPLLMAKRLLANFDPDVILMITPELLPLQIVCRTGLSRFPRCV